MIDLFVLGYDLENNRLMITPQEAERGRRLRGGPRLEPLARPLFLSAVKPIGSAIPQRVRTCQADAISVRLENDRPGRAQ